LRPSQTQQPPSSSSNKDRLDKLFGMSRTTTRTAAELAKKRDNTLKARAFLKIDISRPLPYALEVRHESFMTPDFFELLRKHNIAFVFADAAGKWPYAEDLTADFIYIRLHGDTKLYASSYNSKALDRWSDRIKKWRCGKQPRHA